MARTITTPSTPSSLAAAPVPRQPAPIGASSAPAPSTLAAATVPRQDTRNNVKRYPKVRSNQLQETKEVIAAFTVTSNEAMAQLKATCELIHLNESFHKQAPAAVWGQGPSWRPVKSHPRPSSSALQTFPIGARPTSAPPASPTPTPIGARPAPTPSTPSTLAAAPVPRQPAPAAPVPRQDTRNTVKRYLEVKSNQLQDTKVLIAAFTVTRNEAMAQL